MNHLSIEAIRAFFEKEHHVSLTVKQVRRYRSMLGDMQRAYESIASRFDKVGTPKGQRAIIRLVTGSEAHKALIREVGEASLTDQKLVNEATVAFNTQVRKFYDQGHIAEGNRSLVQWLDTWVSSHGLIPLRGGLYPSSKMAFERAGIGLESSQEEAPSTKDQLDNSYKASWILGRIQELLTSLSQVRNIQNLAKGSRGYHDMLEKKGIRESNLTDDDVVFYTQLSRAALDDLEVLTPQQGSEEENNSALESWRSYWLGPEGGQHLSLLLAKKRYSENSPKLKLSVTKKAHSQLQEIIDKEGLVSFADAVNHVLDFYHLFKKP